MNPLWSYRELTQALGLPSVDGPAIGGVSIDSRRVAAGDLFVALPGDPGPRFQPSARSNRDGHDFAAHAVRNGAAAVLAHRPGDYGAPALMVEDTLDALWTLGAAARRRLTCPVVAVTGSSGKTTFKAFAAAVLRGFRAAGSLNNHLGVPLSLASAPRAATAAVIEIGTNHPGEILPLARMTAPTVAVVLNVHQAHIEHFGTVEAIRREKLSIANGLAPSGVFVRPASLAADFRGPTVTFGRDAGDVRLERLAPAAAGDPPSVGGTAVLATPCARIEAPVPGGGIHRATAVCAAAAMLVALDLPLTWLRRLTAVELPRGRGNRANVAGVVIIDESYNANPSSMAATLRAFGAEAGGRRVAVLGDMLELGDGAPAFHAELAPLCADFDAVFCVGSQMRGLYDLLPPRLRAGHADAADANFLDRCVATLRPGDRVLVKASNGVFWSGGFVDRLKAALA